MSDMRLRDFSWAFKNILALTVIVLCLVCPVLTSHADTEEYNPREAGHPLKFIAYLVFPVGVLADYAITRPCYWLVQRDPFYTLFGTRYMGPSKGEEREYATE